MTLAGCSKSDDSTVTPTDNNAELLIRKWTFSDLTVKTDAKSYVIPQTQGNMISVVSDDNAITFNKEGSFSYLSDSKPVMGKWTLINKTLVLINADNVTSNWSVNALTKTDLELASINVDLTKGKDLTDRKVYTEEENSVGAVSLIFLASLGKQNGGTIDLTKEPQPKSIQLILKGKGQ
ncbi:hypothetical protein GJR95_34450 [Spirosoma endbachense]|uniref:Lipocalin-like domain-containing protein n=2 Tax=Spirosoma endbachense TaxID=2666025 RepID=A0A6P1W306_9BACT|nr:hypothetical protein GJR95_34450 [Spirosoma endbachense]